jgi:hypothetical protein
MSVPPSGEPPRLFDLRWEPRETHVPAEARELARRKQLRFTTEEAAVTSVSPGPTADLLDLFERATNPEDPRELLELFLSRVESRVTAANVVPGREGRAEAWRSTRRRRTVTAAEVMASHSTVVLVKELFNAYFRDDLYGDLRRDDSIILSSGSVDEELYGLPGPMRDCIGYAIQRDWYGYSDSRGRDASREALAPSRPAWPESPMTSATSVSDSAGPR